MSRLAEQVLRDVLAGQPPTLQRVLAELPHWTRRPYTDRSQGRRNSLHVGLHVELVVTDEGLRLDVPVRDDDGQLWLWSSRTLPGPRAAADDAPGEPGAGEPDGEALDAEDERRGDVLAHGSVQAGPEHPEPLPADDTPCGRAGCGHPLARHEERHRLSRLYAQVQPRRQNPGAGCELCECLVYQPPGEGT